jgi:oligopeptide transport system permease protein
VVRYLVRRLLQMVVTFFGATFLVYALMFANQDDPLQALAGDRPISDAQLLAFIMLGAAIRDAFDPTLR